MKETFLWAIGKTIFPVWKMDFFKKEENMGKRNLAIFMAALAVLLISLPAWAASNDDTCGACHQQRVQDLAASSHSGLVCDACHEGSVNHNGNTSSKPTVHFDLEVCKDCHPDQYGTYTYGDDWKTKYGGSPGPHAVMPLPNGDPNLWPKLNDFANYNDIIDGYGFTREYNEERSHNVMIQDHYDITRGKKDTCLQCKSTKLAYYWDTGQEREILNDTYVKAGHMAEGITVPGGTTVSMYTARYADYPYTHEARVLVTLPDGTKYSSYDPATKNGIWTWSALYALTVNELAPDSPTRPSGNGCNHCHDPHKVARDDRYDRYDGHDKNGELVGFRIIRKSLQYAINNKGINPYRSRSPKVFNGDTPLTLDESIALCAQCHVEYVCGDSPIDKIDRDYFPWAKAFDIEDVYATTFPGYGVYDYKYVQDWIHGTGPLSSPNSPGNSVYYNTPYPIQEELIKSQHPEAETYWDGKHYDEGAKCFLCHMPKVTKTNGTRFTSHWLASPFKYLSPEPVAAFANAFDLRLTQLEDEEVISPCSACHEHRYKNMKREGESEQNTIYELALEVQDALVASMAAIKAAKDAGGDTTLIDAAAEDHRAAHVRWENLVVSENSMGFHNWDEVEMELETARYLARSAKQKAENALGEPPPSACSGLDRRACRQRDDCRWDWDNRTCVPK